MPNVHWFPGVQLNYVSQLLRHVEGQEADCLSAVVFRNERLQREGRSLEIGWGSKACAKTSGGP
jgi:acetoacetyl-CoA synthetase